MADVIEFGSEREEKNENKNERQTDDVCQIVRRAADGLWQSGSAGAEKENKWRLVDEEAENRARETKNGRSCSGKEARRLRVLFFFFVRLAWWMVGGGP